MNGSTQDMIEPTAIEETPNQSKYDAVVNSTLYWVNKQAYYVALKEVLPTLKAENGAVLLYLINKVIDLSVSPPQIAKATEGAQKEAIMQVIAQFGLPATPSAYDIIVKNWPALFDWPLKMASVEVLSLAGSFHINAPKETVVTIQHFAFYKLIAEVQVAGEKGIGSTPRVLPINWPASAVVQDGTIRFLLHDTIIRSSIVGSVSVKAKGYDGTEQYAGSFNVSDSALQSLNINVDLRIPPVLKGAQTTRGAPSTASKKIRGRLVALSTACALKATVVVQAKATEDSAWTIESSGISDKTGNFALPYPYGSYTSAKALNSLDPASATVVAANASAPNGESISDAFLYILIKDPSTSKADGKEDDCNCNAPIKADRLPSPEELIQSNQFTQDLGGGCMNLSTPNRALREFNYAGLVRMTDPDVANYTLSARSSWVNGEEVVQYALTRHGKVSRKYIDIDNQVEWQDIDQIGQNTTLFQAVTVSTGHVLTYKSEFRADGYSLGNLLHSLPLAPGQKKQIVTFDSSHTLRGSEGQGMSQEERIEAQLTSERDVIDTIVGSIGENLRGQSDANTSGISASASASASYMGMSAAASVTGGSSNSNSTASQDSSRKTTGFFGEKIKQGVNQNAESFRAQNPSVVTTVQENQGYAAETFVVANHNHCHTITILHWEVLRHFAIFQELVDVEECIFIPFPLTRFTIANVSKWADDLVTHLRPLRSNTFLHPNVIGTAPRHPLARAFDAAERVRTNWALVDYPNSPYDAEPIQWTQGEMTITIDIPRPRTKYDGIQSLSITDDVVKAKFASLGALASFFWSVSSETPVREPWLPFSDTVLISLRLGRDGPRIHLRQFPVPQSQLARSPTRSDRLHSDLSAFQRIWPNHRSTCLLFGRA